jgi:integrase/recombinase XerD
MASKRLDLVGEAYLDWLTIEKGRSPRTVQSYRQDLLRYEESLETMGRKVTTAQPADIDSHLDRLRNEKKASASIARSRSAIKGLYTFLLDEGALSVDPSVNASAVRVPSRIPKALSEDSVLRLLESISGDDPLSLRDRAVLELLYGTGARVSEIVTLNLSDLSYDEGLLRLIGKGDKERLVPVGRAAHEAVSSWTSPLGRSRLIGEKSLSREDQHALFLNQRAKRITRQGIHLMVQKRAERAGLESVVSPHVLRHSCATHMLAHGADVRVVQELLGHSSVATTQIYTKVSQDHLVVAYTDAHPRASGPTPT